MQGQRNRQPLHLFALVKGSHSKNLRAGLRIGVMVLCGSGGEHDPHGADSQQTRATKDADH